MCLKIERLSESENFTGFNTIEIVSKVYLPGTPRTAAPLFLFVTVQSRDVLFISRRPLFVDLILAQCSHFRCINVRRDVFREISDV